jgi:hypothetical protein
VTKEKDEFEEILTQAYKRMHRYTCAEASLQALLALWKLPKPYSWATAGYLGAITSGQTSCGLLIGSSIAIGFRIGQGVKDIPELNERERNRAIQAVNELYSEFLKKFGSSDCKTLSEVDFVKPEEIAKWTISRGWKKTCDVFLHFVIDKCVQMAENGII